MKDLSKKSKSFARIAGLILFIALLFGNVRLLFNDNVSDMSIMGFNIGTISDLYAQPQSVYVSSCEDLQARTGWDCNQFCGTATEGRCGYKLSQYCATTSYWYTAVNPNLYIVIDCSKNPSGTD